MRTVCSFLISFTFGFIIGCEATTPGEYKKSPPYIERGVVEEEKTELPEPPTDNKYWPDA